MGLFAPWLPGGVGRKIGQSEMQKSQNRAEAGSYDRAELELIDIALREGLLVTSIRH